MTEPILEYMNRPVRYNMIDGLGEMGIGIQLLGLMLFQQLGAVAPEDSIRHWKYTPLVCALALLVLIVLLSKMLKKRITYPRTGYVKYRHSGVKTAVAGIVAGGIAVAAVYALHLWRAQYAMALFGSLGMAALYAYATKMDRCWRWIVALIMAIAPVALYAALPSMRDLDKAGSGIIGLCWLVSGTITLCLYIRATQPRQDA